MIYTKMKKNTFFISMVIGSIILTLAIYLLGQNLKEIAFAPDTGYAHYYWKLPEPDTMARITAWTGYILHQVISWYIIYKAQKNRKPFDNKLTKYNYWMLAVQLIFAVLHLIQTHIWYDGLAQDTHIMISQGSVIGMLILGLIMLNNSRGLIFGWKAPIPQSVTSFVRKYHGYYIMWALIFTFWYHPMEPLAPHVTGFFYMFLLMIQSVMLYNKVHLNKYWITLLEAGVLIHGTVVAIATGNGMWPMFFSGFGFILIATQIYLFKKMSKAARILIQVLYFVTILFIYTGGFSSGKTISDIHQFTWIPIIEYGLAVLISVLIWIGVRLSKRN